MDCAVTIHLIRHEKTAANSARQYIGWTDEPIVTRPKPLSHMQPTIVYCSDLKRCVQTAEGYFPKAIVKTDVGLRELHFGDFELKTYEQLQYQPTYRNWIDDPIHYAPPNGERFLDFQSRVLAAIQHTVTEPIVYTFVVHGGVIRLLLAHFTYLGTFQQVHAAHQTCYTCTWDRLQAFKEGQSCTSFSEEPLMVSEHM